MQLLFLKVFMWFSVVFAIILCKWSHAFNFFTLPNSYVQYFSYFFDILDIKITDEDSDQSRNVWKYIIFGVIISGPYSQLLTISCEMYHIRVNTSPNYVYLKNNKFLGIIINSNRIVEFKIFCHCLILQTVYFPH